MVACAKALVDHNKSLLHYVRPSDQATALHAAAQAGHSAMVRVVERGLFPLAWINRWHL